MRVGQEIVFSPVGIVADVLALSRDKTERLEAVFGNEVAFKVKSPRCDRPQRGMVVGDPDRDPPQECLSFIAEMVILDHPGEIHAGYKSLCICHKACVPCRFDALIQRTDYRQGKRVIDSPEWIQKAMGLS